MGVVTRHEIKGKDSAQVARLEFFRKSRASVFVVIRYERMGKDSIQMRRHKSFQKSRALVGVDSRRKSEVTI